MSFQASGSEKVGWIHTFDAALKGSMLIALLELFGLWLGIGIVGSILVGVGYGFFTPWVCLIGFGCVLERGCEQGFVAFVQSNFVGFECC
ncbi:hypothetical protein RJT34_04959 [Clitoria ternatea]|uniref:Uncharacterized protein n=1 Tax=Clitoria ternatea TaxID=43366 RepID=A0AAN9Q6P2_CLITE